MAQFERHICQNCDERYGEYRAEFGQWLCDQCYAFSTFETAEE